MNICSWLSTLRCRGLVPDADEALAAMMRHGRLNPEHEEPAMAAASVSMRPMALSAETRRVLEEALGFAP